MRIALGLEYDGSAFCGWQSQASACGVQDHLEKALGALAAERICVTAAGRTDAGVHASAQVVLHAAARRLGLPAAERGAVVLEAEGDAHGPPGGVRARR